MSAKNELTVREAVELTGFTRQWVYNLIVNGRIPVRRVPGFGGGEYRLDRRALLDYVRKIRSRRNVHREQQATA